MYKTMQAGNIKDITELEKSTAPCWLWDPILNRISWANKAGLKFWGADTIFDILERRFDPSEQVVMFINGCYKELSSAAKQFSEDISGYSCEEDLAFQSSQYKQRYTFKLTLMRLSDQRIGLLHQAITHPFTQADQGKNAISVSMLPMPAFLLDATGKIIEQNLASEGFTSLEAHLPALVETCASAAMVNDSLTLDTDFGHRHIRYTLKKCNPDDEASSYLFVFDDVTERKRTEKEMIEKLSHKEIRTQLTPSSTKEASDTGRLSPEEANKFLALRQTLAENKSPSELNSERSDNQVGHEQHKNDEPHGGDKDITREETEHVRIRLHEVQAILDAAMDGIFTLDASGKIKSVNAGAEAIFGLSSHDVSGREFSSLFDDESTEIVQQYLASLGEKGIASIFNDGREVYGIEKQGGRIPIFLTINPLPAQDDRKDGEPNALYCALVRDITQWKETETELRQAKEEAEQASMDKSSFLSSLSHEIRTPLNAILGFVDLMKTEKFGPLGDDRYKGYLTDIQTSGTHLMELTSGLLDLARMQAGKMEMNFTSVETSDIIEQCVSILQEEAKRENILIRTDLTSDLPQIVADQGAMRQIILNLVSNSIKFSKPGSQVIISTKLESSGEVTINVSDTGIGMNEDEVKMALEPFSQTPRGKKTTKIIGTGLGLPLSKALTEANRARFAITSSLKSGTSIDITFPNSRVLTE